MAMVMWAIIVCGLLSLVYGALTVRAVMAADPGTQRMQEIAAAIREGALAFLNREYRVLALFVAAVAFVLTVVL
ncbi:MAG TPA: sodium/proton-translocating pyrophosphatase, partial [Hyphomicrobiaceae bacterium]|nr:sodium/proton-translocating pyrophosphatase [Hyphomicrobiaceae bacterium]